MSRDVCIGNFLKVVTCRRNGGLLLYEAGLLELGLHLRIQAFCQTLCACLLEDSHVLSDGHIEQVLYFNLALCECLVNAENDFKQGHDIFDSRPGDVQLPFCVTKLQFPSIALFLSCALKNHDLSTAKFPSCVVELALSIVRFPFYVPRFHILSIVL